MTPFPDAVESSPVPPNNDNVSLSRSIAMSLEPSETSKSCAVMFASTTGKDIDSVKLLLSLGAKCYNHNVLKIVQEDGHTEIIKLLEKYKEK